MSKSNSQSSEQKMFFKGNNSMGISMGIMNLDWKLIRLIPTSHDGCFYYYPWIFPTDQQARLFPKSSK